jgi:hypothetical protein
MRIKVREIGKGLHPNELVVEVQTLEGAEHLVVDKRTIKKSTLLVGVPLRTEGNRVLVELPRETTSGAWRVWVKSDALEAVKAA